MDVIFVGALWNFEFSNEVRMIKFSSREQFLDDLRTYAPKWVVVGNHDARDAIEASGAWEQVGRLTSALDHVAFRRKR